MLHFLVRYENMDIFFLLHRLSLHLHCHPVVNYVQNLNSTSSEVTFNISKLITKIIRNTFHL